MGFLSLAASLDSISNGIQRKWQARHNLRTPPISKYYYIHPIDWYLKRVKIYSDNFLIHLSIHIHPLHNMKRKWGKVGSLLVFFLLTSFYACIIVKEWINELSEGRKQKNINKYYLIWCMRCFMHVYVLTYYFLALHILFSLVLCSYSEWHMADIWVCGKKGNCWNDTQWSIKHLIGLVYCGEIKDCDWNF